MRIEDISEYDLRHLIAKHNSQIAALREYLERGVGSEMKQARRQAALRQLERKLPAVRRELERRRDLVSKHKVFSRHQLV